MLLNLRYVNLITLTVFSLLGFGMVYPEGKQVTSNAKLQYHYGEKAQASPNNNSQLEIEKLNKNCTGRANQPHSKAVKFRFGESQSSSG